MYFGLREIFSQPFSNRWDKCEVKCGNFDKRKDLFNKAHESVIKSSRKFQFYD